jgi:uncharacterized protein YjiS (DUF1127 family)
VHHFAQLHGRCFLFALQNKDGRDYIDGNRRSGDPAARENHLRKTMNPIRIAKNWISYRRTLAELGSLSNQTLSDIGVTRYDIRSIASRSFR